MKEKNILILGNGFDISLRRQTSYEDFIRFSSQIIGYHNDYSRINSFSSIFTDTENPNVPIEELFINKKKQVIRILINNFIDQYSERFPKINKNSFSFLYNYIEYFYQRTMYEGLVIVAKEFDNLLINNINSNKSGFIEKKIDNILIHKNISLHEIMSKIVLELITESEFYKLKVENQQLRNNKLTNQEQYQTFSEFFSEFQNNVIFKSIILNKSNIENWNNLENQISQLSKAVMFLKDDVANLPDELFYKKYEALFEYEDLIDENFKNFSNTKHILFIIDELALFVPFLSHIIFLTIIFQEFSKIKSL